MWHKDSKGNAEELGRGAIQFMSAGTGVSHSEANHGGEPLRFVQSWILPRKRGLTPSYGSASGFDRQDKWAYMVGDKDAAGEEAQVQIHQDMHMFATELGPTKCLDFDVREGRRPTCSFWKATSRSTRRGSRRGTRARSRARSRLILPRAPRARTLLLYEMALSSDGRADAVLP